MATPAPRIWHLTTNERAERGITHLIEVTADNLDQASTNTAQTLTTTLQFAIGTYIERVSTYLPIPFQNSADAAFNTDTMSVGDSVGGVATILAAIELNANGTFITYKTAVPTGTPSTGFTAASFLTITLNSMAAKALLSLNVGVVYVGVRAFNIKGLGDAASYGPIQTK